MVQKQLRDGLILRSLSEGTDKDRETLPQFYFKVFDAVSDEYDESGLPILIEDMLNNHPTMTLDDYWVVVDPAKDEQIVSATLLIPQVWQYGGIEFGMGRPEIVATHEDYRNRGLIRELMMVCHQRSAKLGHLMQGITGIPEYYRKFGYATTVPLGSIGTLPLDQIKDVEEDAPFTLRPATDDDIPHLIRITDIMSQDYLMSVKRNADEWSYDMHGKRPEAEDKAYLLMIENKDKQVVGYVNVAVDVSDAKTMQLWAYGVDGNASYVSTYKHVLSGIKHWYNSTYPGAEKKPVYLQFAAGIHPSIMKMVSLNSKANVRDREAMYTWFIRVEDIVAFIRAVQPVLEARLDNSTLRHYTGELKITFFDKTGLNMKFENGKITEVSDQPPKMFKDNAGFPDQSFLSLLFGHKTLDDLRLIYQGAYANPEQYLLLDALFPKQPSWLMAMI